jgi:hypothetical protein
MVTVSPTVPTFLRMCRSEVRVPRKNRSLGSSSLFTTVQADRVVMSHGMFRKVVDDSNT